ncbi:hypothetical protein Stsp02_69970 [Streptomyces sp. NBRC 14336]|uniref:hypothetical protein n=1 Tax=Streptomyces sp. NBRC 14336 TaxID=3030992 RepID=UPI0024A4AEB7|nr:hypothetical protein [Streptomyces sp. NBRC 14336]WBO82675.1 hypothetical protein SBE_006314 [Streptomyces sp. SBE_14.2]GLW51336.1 hypothetical protein Stsp02_69970 [Streptomyces sp. NBRC 14336]
MARRDMEQMIGEIRGMLADPTTGLTAQHQVQESRHGKVLEHVTYSTTGVREENRELRRRQERMLTELGKVRSAVDELRREIAQAWAHIVTVRRDPRPGEVPDPTPALEAADSFDDERKDEIPVADQPTPNAAEGPSDRVPGPLAVTDGAPPATRNAAEDSASTPDQQEEYRRGLLAAAAVSSARLICHKDTWAFLVEKSVAHSHFRLPDRITDTDDGQIDTHLSGRSLLAVLVTTRQILDSPAGDDLAAWALAHVIHTRTHEAVTAAAGSGRSGQGEVTTIVLDDRPAGG